MKSLSSRFMMLAILASSTSMAHAWKLDLNFNNGTIGTSVNSNPGSLMEAGGNTLYTTEQSYEGGKAVEMNIAKGETAWGFWGGVINHPTQLKKGNEIWFRVRTYFPVGFNYDSYGEGGHLKFLRIHTQTPGGENEGSNDWYINPKGSDIAHKFIFEGEQWWATISNRETAIVLGKWETYEFYVKFDNVPVSAGGTARIRAWKNGELLADITDRKTLTYANSVSDRTHLFTYWNGGAPQTQKMFVDDIVLTSDVPAGRDSKNNPYVGAGTLVTSMNPRPPTLVVLKSGL